MRHCRMRRRDKNTTSLDTVRYLMRALKVERGNISTNTLTLILTTGSRTLISTVRIDIPGIRDTLRSTFGPTRRPTLGTRGTFKEALALVLFLMTCLTTWKSCSLLTSTTSGLTVRFKGLQNSTVERLHNVEGIW